jgi:hypothetical protein
MSRHAPSQLIAPLGCRAAAISFKQKNFERHQRGGVLSLQSMGTGRKKGNPNGELT